MFSNKYRSNYAHIATLRTNLLIFTIVLMNDNFRIFHTHQKSEKGLNYPFKIIKLDVTRVRENKTEMCIKQIAIKNTFITLTVLL